ncbi:hypothetical protein CONLIGDRAFT_683967 [Coniochaeta ligniaria NRRL 30616]|uniref:Uncharacterized protein n=1 Tax=Coniochaeta ligniaria NRRL 30616 TaxID=1408157 RepID=A0A1J7II33_9PEZI|nr:hypothetical protein CONLIGDRAFT_683967 [Coniochaeta ligniaria NRRL 30616]
MSLAYDRLRGVDPEEQPFTDVNVGAEKQETAMTQAEAPRGSRMGKLRQLLLTVVGILCLWITLVTAWRTTLHPVPRAVRYEKRTLSCGNTTDEAQSRGCAFDLLSHNWVPPPCLDPLSESEYRDYVSSPERALGPYPYYLDQAGTQHIADEHTFALLANGPTLADQHVFTTREEHLAHCGFLLRRTHRAAQGIVRLNDENIQYWHTKHCIEELGHPNRKPLTELNEGFYIGFATCTIEEAV